MPRYMMLLSLINCFNLLFQLRLTDDTNTLILLPEQQPAFWSHFNKLKKVQSEKLHLSGSRYWWWMCSREMSPCDHPRQRLRAAFMTLPFFLRGIIGPWRKQSAACSVVYSGMMAHRPQRRARMAEFFFSPRSCDLISVSGTQKLGWGPERKASTKQWIQSSSVRAASVMTVCRSEGWHSYSDKPFNKQWEHSGGDTIQRLFLSDVLHQSWAWVHQKSLWIFTKFIAKQDINHCFHLRQCWKGLVVAICNTPWHKHVHRKWIFQWRKGRIRSNQTPEVPLFIHREPHKISKTTKKYNDRLFSYITE